MWSVRDIGCEFDAAVDGAWGEHEEFRFGAADALCIHAEESGVFGDGGEEGAALAFELNAEEVNAVDFGENFVEVEGDFDSELSDFAGDERGRAANDDSGTEFDESVNVGAGDAAVANVTDKCHGQSGDAATVAADGEDIEQSLCGMFVGAITGIEDTSAEVSGEQVWGTGSFVAADNQIDAHGFDSHRGVDEGFAFGKAAGAGGKVDGVGTQPTGSQTEAGAGASGVFEKQVGDDDAFECVESIATAAGGVVKRIGEFEHGIELGGREFFELQQMLQAPGAGSIEVCKFQRHAAILKQKLWSHRDADASRQSARGGTGAEG